MEATRNSTETRHTFADKFSKFKGRFLLIFWFLVLTVFIIYTTPIFSLFYSITKINESFYTISIMDNHAEYKKVESAPASWLPLSKISKRVQQAIVSSEDGQFYIHPGYDAEQLQAAINDSFVLKKRMRGASTITQQLAKNLYLSKSKTFGRKASELVMAVMIEKYSNKQKILETYLNIIEYGKGLYGIDKAAKLYFNKPAAMLNAREAAFIAMLLPSPVKYSKSFKNKALTPFAKRTVDSILLKMQQAGYISMEEYLIQLEGKFSWEKNLSSDDMKENIKEELNENDSGDME